MRVRDLREKIGKAPVPPVLLFCPGTTPYKKDLSWEPLLADRAVQELVKAYVPEGMGDLVYSVFHADETPVTDIVQEARTMPFLADRRVILVRNAERYNLMSGEKRSPLSALLDYFDEPCDTALLMLVTSQIDKRKKFYKACEKIGAVVECPQLDDRELSAWIRAEAENRGKTIDPNAIQEILRRSGNHLSDCFNAINLVATYLGEAQNISVQDVVMACADVAEESIWALTDAIAASNTEKALRALRQLIDFGKSPDELMGLINWLLETAYQASPETKLSVKSKFVADKVLPLANKLGLAKLKAAFALCTETHFLMRSTGVDKNLALEMLVIKLAFAKSAKPPARPVRA